MNICVYAHIFSPKGQETVDSILNDQDLFSSKQNISIKKNQNMLQISNRISIMKTITKRQY